jgi:threonine aldolase
VAEVAGEPRVLHLYLEPETQGTVAVATAVAERWPEAGVDVASIRTNVVTWRHPSPGEVLDHLRAEGVVAGTIAPGVLRLVTHVDVDDDGIERARKALASAP